MGFLKNLKGYAKDAAAAKVDEAKAMARDAVASTSVGSAAIGFVDKVNAQAERRPPANAGQLVIQGEAKQNLYIYQPGPLPPMSEGDRVWLEVREHGEPMVSVSTGTRWDEESNPGTFPVFFDGEQIGMTSAMHGFYRHAFDDGLQVVVSGTCHGMYDELIPDLYIDGWSYGEWVEFFEGKR